MTQFDETYGDRKRRERQQDSVIRFLVILSLAAIGLGCLFYMLRAAGRI